MSDTEQNFDHAFLALVRARNEVTIVLAGAASRARLLKEPLRART